MKDHVEQLYAFVPDGLANLASSKSIVTIDLRDCSGITDQGLRFLMKILMLHKVSVIGCPNITSAGVDALRKAFPDKIIETDDTEWSMRTK